ncbi:endodeoxyribonuclease [Gonapodya sp. JEL0774]|nr:endodeoxyribonuclease [Gonapodya sp. JEL0774]
MDSPQKLCLTHFEVSPSHLAVEASPGIITEGRIDSQVQPITPVTLEQNHMRDDDIFLSHDECGENVSNCAPEESEIDFADEYSFTLDFEGEGEEEMEQPVIDIGVGKTDDEAISGNLISLRGCGFHAADEPVHFQPPPSILFSQSAGVSITSASSLQVVPTELELDPEPAFDLAEYLGRLEREAGYAPYVEPIDRDGSEQKPIISVNVEQVAHTENADNDFATVSASESELDTEFEQKVTLLNIYDIRVTQKALAGEDDAFGESYMGSAGISGRTENPSEDDLAGWGNVHLKTNNGDPKEDGEHREDSEEIRDQGSDREMETHEGFKRADTTTIERGVAKTLHDENVAVSTGSQRKGENVLVLFPPFSRSNIRKIAIVYRILNLSRLLLLSGRTATTRDAYYRDVNLFGCQASLERSLATILHLVGLPRHALNLRASSKGLLAGAVEYMTRDGRTVKGPQTGEVATCDFFESLLSVQLLAPVLLVIEKEAVLRSLLSLGIGRYCTLVTGKGYPDVATRWFVRKAIDDGDLEGGLGKGLRRASDHIQEKCSVHESDEREVENTPKTKEANGDEQWDCIESTRADETCPGARSSTTRVVALVDGDPHGYEIYLTYKYGSDALREHRDELSVPSLELAGIEFADRERFHISDESLIPLSERDEKKAQQLLRRSQIMLDTELAENLKAMLASGTKIELQALQEANVHNTKGEGSSWLIGDVDLLRQYVAVKVLGEQYAGTQQRSAGSTS